MTTPIEHVAADLPLSQSASLPTGKWRVGLLGAGYIAEWHVKALRLLNNIELIAICDRLMSRAKSSAQSLGIANVYGSLEDMLAQQNLDCIHILLPPEAHYAAATQVLNAGVHVVLEKPMCVDAKQCADLASLAQEKGLRLAVGHNFLFHQKYDLLRNDVRNGFLGPLDHVAINWNLELGQVRFGPHESWLFRDPRNVLLEIGPHLVSLLLDVVGQPDQLSAEASNPVTLPTGMTFFRRWQVRAHVGRTVIDLNMSFIPGFAERYIRVRGRLASATADIERDTYVRHEHSPSGDDFDRYAMIRREAKSLTRQGSTNIRNYIFSKFKRSLRGSAYSDSIAGALRAFYTPKQLDERISPDFGKRTIALCQFIGREAMLPALNPTRVNTRSYTNKLDPKILVLGATGFIGKELVRQLNAAGHPVRILARTARTVPAGLDPNLVEIFPGDLNNREDISNAIAGMDCVYHLARAHVKRWDDYQRFEIDVTKNIAEACLDHHIRRFIYTGTIDSFYAGTGSGTITDETPLDRNISRRNLYARAKAESESILLNLQRNRKLPLVILRPGIVIGLGSSPMHWGVGMWKHDSVCHIWGDGHNKLPLVLVEDVASALVAALDAKDVDGQSFNLVAGASLSANEYLDALETVGKIKIQRYPTSPFKFYMGDMAKWVIKVLVRHHDTRRPSYRDWDSRTQRAAWDCSKAKRLLNWNPVSEPAILIDRGIRTPLEDLLS